LQVGKEVGAHIGFDFRAHYVSHRRHIIVGTGVDYPQHQIKNAAPYHKGVGKAFKIGGGNVGYPSYYEGKHQLAKGGKSRTKQVKGENVAVFFEIGQKTLYQGHKALLFLGVLFHFFRSLCIYASLIDIRLVDQS